MFCIISLFNISVPGPPANVIFPLPDIQETSFVVQITQPHEGEQDGYCVTLTEPENIELRREKCKDGEGSINFTFSNLQVGSLYQISVISTLLHTNGSTPYHATVYTSKYIMPVLRGIHNVEKGQLFYKNLPHLFIVNRFLT